MSNQTKETPAVQVAALLKNPELLRVTTVSAKVIQQIQIEHDFTAWDNVEIIGVVGQSKNILAKDRHTSHIRYIAALQFLLAAEDKFKEAGLDRASANAEAHKALNALPQVFKV